MSALILPRSQRPVLVLCLLAFLPSGKVSAQEPSISGRLNATEVFVGEPVFYTVEVANVGEPPEPDLSSFEDFDVQLLGQSSQNSQSITIINGVRKETRRFGKVFQYQLTPRKSGVLTVPAPRVKVDGEEIVGEASKLEVKGESEQETVFLNTTVEPADVYPTQEFRVVLEVDVRKLPPPLEDRSPLSIQEAVTLNIPWLTETGVPSSTPIQDLQEVLLSVMAPRGQQDGFGINGYTTRGGGFFGRPVAARFLPKAEEVTRTLQDGTQAEFFRYRISRTFRAERAGEVQVPAASIKGTFAKPDTDPVDGEKLFAVSNRATMTVSEVPVAGRPDTYCGGVGKFDVSSSVSPQSAAVGDPMTLTINIFGEGTLDLIVAPDLDRVDSLTKAFRIYEPVAESVGNRRTFTYTVIPETDTVAMVPEIPISYFDVEQGKYVTVKTDPLPVTIRPAKPRKSEGVPQEDPSAAEGPAPSQGEAADAASDDEDSSREDDQANGESWLTWQQWSVLGLLIAMGLIFFFLVRSSSPRAGPAGVRARARRAFATAEASLKVAETAAEEPGAMTGTTLVKILTGLIAEITEQDAGRLGPAEATATLAGLGVPAELREQIGQLLSECDAARFGSTADEQKAQVERCRNLLRDLKQAV